MNDNSFDFQIIANLLAGKGEAKKKLDELTAFLKTHGQTYRVCSIEKVTRISQLPSDGEIIIKKGVICLGGDGTVSETVGYLLNNKLQVPLALIPTGTANIIAETLGLNWKTDDYGFILKENFKKASVGVAEYSNGREYFLLGLGLGFEENFLRLTKEKFKNTLGVFSYIFAAFSELHSLKKIPLIVQADRFQAEINVCLLTVLNFQPIILKHFPLFKDKRIQIDNDVFKFYYVEYKNYLQALAGTLAFHLLGKKNFGLVKEVGGNNITINSPMKVETQVDGELRGSLPVKIFLHDQKLSFLVP